MDETDFTHEDAARVEAFIRKYAYKSAKPIAGRIQSMLALMEKLRYDPSLSIDDHLSEAKQALVGHETHGQNAVERLGLKALNRLHGRRSSNIGSWGQPMLDFLQTMGFEEISPEANAPVLMCFDTVLARHLMSLVEQGPIQVRTKNRTIESVVAAILNEAEARGKGGEVAQYLVAAKLEVRLGIELPVRPANTSDRQSHKDAKARLGDFEFDGTVIEVAVGVMDLKHLSQLKDIVSEHEKEAWLLTRESRVAVWRTAVNDTLAARAGQVVVASVESFVGQNVTEMAGFSNQEKLIRLEQLVCRYNERWIASVGTPGMAITLI